MYSKGFQIICSMICNKFGHVAMKLNCTNNNGTKLNLTNMKGSTLHANQNYWFKCIKPLTVRKYWWCKIQFQNYQQMDSSVGSKYVLKLPICHYITRYMRKTYHYYCIRHLIFSPELFNYLRAQFKIWKARTLDYSCAIYSGVLRI